MARRRSRYAAPGSRARRVAGPRARRSRYSAPGPRAGSVLLDTRARRRRRWRPRGVRLLFALLVLGAIGAGVYVWRSHVEPGEARREAAQRFVAAWTKRDRAAMWRALSPRARAATPRRRFAGAYENAGRAAGVRRVP